MFFDSDTSKEAIKTRMLRVALTYWETNNIDEVDPVVKLLMEALSAELYDVVNDIKNAEGRILEKMAHLLAPDLLTSPVPAHAVMQASPAEAVETLSDSVHFFVEKKIASKQDGPVDTAVDLHFSPVNKAHIYHAQIKTLFTGTSLFSFDNASNKLLAGSVQKGAQANECCLWLGMNLHSRITNINGLQFFFDLKNLDPIVADFFYQFLPLTKWYINDKEISINSGLESNSNDNGKSTGGGMSNGDLMELLKKNINNYYHKKFVTITDASFEVTGESLQIHPSTFATAFSPAVTQKMTEELLWIKIVFPVNIQQELLNDVAIHLNAFPVMNCKLNELRYRLRSGRNIIPIPSTANEHFIALRSFTDGVAEYKALPYRKSSDDEVGTYTLRSGGLERFDSRNGRETIQYLLELLRSESAAFSAFGHDFIASTLKEMNQFIALMEQKTNTTIDNASDIPNYIIVKPFENQELMYIEYWTTNTELANNLRSGTKLQQTNGISLKPGSLTFLTSSTGGKDKLRPEEKLYAFKYGLLTRDRIVTVQDIRSFCFYELGSKLSSVAVKKGFAISNNPKEGIKRTIDVLLTPANTKAADNEEWDRLCLQLKSKLETRSGMSYNYRIISNATATY